MKADQTIEKMAWLRAFEWLDVAPDKTLALEHNPTNNFSASSHYLLTQLDKSSHHIFYFTAPH